MEVHGIGSVEKRGKGRWRLRAVIGYKSDGAPKFKYKTVPAASKTEAHRLLERWIEELRQLPEGNSKGDLTCGELFDEYLRFCRDDGVALSTITRNRQVVEGRLKPELGPVKVRELTPGMLTEFYRKAKTAGRKRDNGPLTTSTMKKISSFVGQALDFAVSEGIIAENPNKRAKKLTGTRRGAHRKVDEIAFSAEEMRKIIARAIICPNRALATAVVIAAHTGMRRSEVLGLVWGDVDWDNDVLNVERGLTEVAKELSTGETTLSLGMTKSKNSDRIVPIVPVLKDYLLEERERQERAWMWEGKELGDDAPIVQSKHGGAFRPNTITTEFKNMIQDIDGVNPEASFKSLRSGVASLLAAEGVPLMQVAWLLGDDPATVKRYYVKRVNDPNWAKLRDVIAGSTAPKSA